MPGQEGTYNLKVYFSDEKGNVAYMTFKITIKEVYVPSLTVKGAGAGQYRHRAETLCRIQLQRRLHH